MSQQEILGPVGYNQITSKRVRVPVKGAEAHCSLARESSLGSEVPELDPDGASPSLAGRGWLGEQGGGSKVQRESGLLTFKMVLTAIHTSVLVACLLAGVRTEK